MYRDSFTFCCLSIESSSISVPELETILPIICSSCPLRRSACSSRAATRLSIERMMVVFIALSEVFISSTSGFFSLLPARRRSRVRTMSLYSVIWLSMSEFVSPELAGIRSLECDGSVMYPLIY